MITTIGDLIKELQKYNPNCRVAITKLLDSQFATTNIEEVVQNIPDDGTVFIRARK